MNPEPATDASAPERIRAFEPGEEERLREIALAAKAHWGYDLGRIRAWTDTLEFAPGGPRREVIDVAEVDGEPVGWARTYHDGGTFWLDDVWVTPAWMGRGIGTRLLRRAAERGRRDGAARMEWEADPNAAGFYRKVGGRHLRDGEPGVWGRRLPVYGLDLR